MMTSSVLSVGLVNTNTYGKTTVYPVSKTDFRSGDYSPSNFEAYHSFSQISPNVMVNAPQQAFPNGLLGRSETSIASSYDGVHLVAGFNDAQGFCGSPFGAPCTPQAGLSGYAYSTNGGRTWTDGGAPPVINNIFSRGDPWLGSNGRTFFYSNMAVNNNTGASLGLAVWRGHFTRSGNFVWTDVHSFDSPRNAINPGSDLYDKESMAVAKDNSGAAYVSVTNFQEICGLPQFGFGTIELWRTHDGGNTWQGPTIVSPDQSISHDPSNPTCGYFGSVQQGSSIAIGPQGQVYVTWQRGPTFLESGLQTQTQIMMATSYDGGVTFGKPIVVGTVNTMFYDTPVAYTRPYMLNSPRISVATSGRDRGRVFITYTGAVNPMIYPNPTIQNLTSTQIFLAYSDNGGHSWKQANILPPPPSTTVKRFFPVVVTGQSGSVDVIYYQSLENPATSTSDCNIYVAQGGFYRTGPAHSLVDVYWLHSADGGVTFESPQQINSVTTDWCSVVSNLYPNMGDYIGATSAGNHVYAIWADGRNGIPDVYMSSMLASGEHGL